jgi:preprotein translocase subunit SecG
MILAAWYHTILAFLFAVIAIVLMLVILLQRGKGVGLAGAFGGTGGATAFGSKTGDVLTWVTVTGAVLLLAFTVLMNYVFVQSGPGLSPGGVPVAPSPDSGTPLPGGTSQAPADGLDLAATIFGESIA